MGGRAVLVGEEGTEAPFRELPKIKTLTRVRKKLFLRLDL